MTALSLEDTVARAHPTAGRAFGDQAAVLVVRSRRLVQLNAVAAKVWTLAATPARLAEIAGMLEQEFEVEPARLRRDVVAFAAELVERGVLVRIAQED